MRSLVLYLCLTATLAAQTPEWAGSARLDRIVSEAVDEGTAPGAVLLVGRGDRILHHKAYGSRSLEPERTPAALDTIYDCASLTKVVVTTTAVMMLVEEGKLRLNDRVATHLPDFEGGLLTVRQLLTHYSGLRPDLDLAPAWSGYETGIAMAVREKPTVEPDSRFVYSDINYILLAEIVRVLSGQRIDEFAADRILGPLGMTDSKFNPAASLRGRIAPTERLPGGTLLHGTVHDPTTRFMGGVAGHAGLFSTAADLGRFARLMLNGGELGGVRLLSPLSVAQMTTPQSPAGKPERGLGWDLDSPYASVRGDLFPKGSYGHTGFTGTSIWIDPFTRAWIVLMTNRVHPTTRTSIVSLRARLASAVAASLDDVDVDAARQAVRLRAAAASAAARPRRRAEVRSGLDVLAQEGFARLRGMRVGLITNHSGLSRKGRRNVDLFVEAGVKIGAIFSPEHGFEGSLDEALIADGRHAPTGAPIISLYQPGRRRPTAEALSGLDALVFDIQDVGTRFYTYATTMAYALEEAAKAKIPFYVLDRPNPITGTRVEGPSLDPKLRSFIGYFEVPVRHGMTLGELALMLNAEKGLGADLRIVAMQGWRRELWFDETGLPWVDPSPNIRTLTQALLYPGVGLLEGLENYSVGRGTDAPFEFVGADWMDSAGLVSDLEQTAAPGAAFYPVRRKPRDSRFRDQEIPGIQIIVIDREEAQPLRLGLEIAAALMRADAPLDWDRLKSWTGDERFPDSLAGGNAASHVWGEWRAQAAAFRERRAPYLLY